MRKYILSILLTLYSLGGYSMGEATVRDSILQNFTEQLKIFPQENLYLQTDKSYYVGGEDIWFRAYLTNYISRTQDTTSRYIYTELINPAGAVIKRIKTIPREGAYFGHVPLETDIPEGAYQLRSYTKYLSGLGDGYMYRRPVYIANFSSALYRIQPDFTLDPEDKKVMVRLSFIEMNTGKLFSPKTIRWKISDEKTKILKLGDDKIVRFNCNPADFKNRMLYIEYDFSGFTHKQYIPIPHPEGTFDLSFFPEGGYFIAGTQMRIGFKAIKSDGLGMPVKGRIVDSSGQTVTGFESNILGMGSFKIKGKSGEQFEAICTLPDGGEKHFKLPLPSDKHLSLQALWIREILNISVSIPNDSLITDSLYLMIHNRGIPLYCEPWNMTRKFLQLRNKDLPQGVLQILLLDSKGQPLSERVVFNQNKADIAELKLQTSQPSYSSKEKIELSLDLDNGTGLLQEGSLAMAVTDDAKVLVDSTHTIITHFLLTSEFSSIKGFIENPGWYFSPSNKNGIAELDHLMLTQGWSRYNVAKILKGDITPPKGELEIGPYISGYVRSGYGYFIKKAGYQVALASMMPSSYEATETDEEGRFQFVNTEMPDSTRFFIQTLRKNGKKYLMELNIDQEKFPEIEYQPPYLPLKMYSQTDAYLAAAEEQYRKENDEWVIHLDEIVIKANKLGKSPLTVPDSRIIDSDQLKQRGNGSLFMTLRTIGDLYVTQDEISWNNSSTLVNKEHAKEKEEMGLFIEPYIIIDELLFDDINFFMGVPIERVEEIEVVRPNSHGAMKLSGEFGSDAYTRGLILITTKERDGGFSSRESTHIKTFKPLGFQKLKTFYSPKYETQAAKDTADIDLRTTLYWNPSIRTRSGKAQVEFYSADNPSDYSVIVEGLTGEGKLVRAAKKISFRKKKDMNN